MARKSPQRGQIVVYQDQPSISSREDSDLMKYHQRRPTSLSTSPIHTTPHTDRYLRVKKTSCPTGLATRREKPARSRPKSLAFDQDMINVDSDEWLTEYTESSDVANMQQPDFRIRKYRSVISLSSDDTSSVKTIPEHTMSKSVHQSPVKPAKTPKMIDVSPQYFSSSSSTQIKSKEQGASRVKQLLFRRISRSSENKNAEVFQKDPVSKRSKSSSSPSTISNMRFLRKKTSDDEENYLLPSPLNDNDLDFSHIPIYTNTITSDYQATLYLSGEESN